jgi:hypothetical protein
MAQLGRSCGLAYDAEPRRKQLDVRPNPLGVQM